MIINQIVLISIWYIAFCVSIETKILKHIRVLVKNYFWFGIIVEIRHAKVQWNKNIQPIIYSNFKFLDPKIQVRTLIAKLIARGILLGIEP